MERRGFLKSIFGAAVVASMPVVVLSQIEKTPPPPNNKLPFPTNNHTKEGLLYIYKDIQLVGQSVLFNLTFKQNYQEVEGGKWEKVWTGKYTKKKGKKKYKWVFVPSEYPEYIKVPSEWFIVSDYIQWFVNPEELFCENDKLNCLIKQEDIKIIGDAYITEMSINSDPSLIYGRSVTLMGSGELILTADE